MSRDVNLIVKLFCEALRRLGLLSFACDDDDAKQVQDGVDNET